VQLILRIVAGPAQGRRIVIRRGQVAEIGRTEWADFSVAADRQMADIHFRVESASEGYRVTNLNAAGETLVNGESIESVVLHSSDRIQAGESSFAVEIEGEPAPTSPQAAVATADRDSAEPELSPAKPRELTAEQCCERLCLGEASRKLLVPDQSAMDFLSVLVEKKLYPDAIRLLGFLLPKPIAVAWCAECVRGVMGDAFSPGENEALEAAERWAAEPSEEHRRQAEQHAQAIGTGSAAGWAGLAAFWSDGSIAPAGLPEVPPGPGLTSRAITAALLIAAPFEKPGLVEQRYQEFLDRGMRHRAACPVD
jgi:hypothetical protein